jgi:CRP-like cAMP-binding protein
MTLDDDISRLSRTRPFNLLPRDALQLIAFSAEKRRLAANENLFEEGDAADSGYFVLSGSLTLTRKGRKGELTRTAGVGALVGENAMLVEVARSSSARARESSVVLRITRPIFQRVLREFPKDAARIRTTLAARTRNITAALEELRARAIDPGP